MLDWKGFLPCTRLEKAADSTKEQQTQVLAAQAQEQAKASSLPIIFFVWTKCWFLTGEAGCDAGGDPANAGKAA